MHWNFAGILFPAVLEVSLMGCSGIQSQAQSLDEVFEFEQNLETQIQKVNEGELRFLTTPVHDRTVHTLTNTFTISASSLQNHWVEFHQCHENLDPVAASQIVFQYRQLRNLRIERYSHIGKAWVAGQTVQMEDVQKQAALCVTAEVNILLPNGSENFSLHSGPYFRKFLDGYYPFHLLLRINYPADHLGIIQVTPLEQAGFTLQYGDGYLVIDSWFEGELSVEVIFICASHIHTTRR